MRCNTGHGVVRALASRAHYVRGICWQSWRTTSTFWGVIWCFGMRHFTLWWMMVVCVGLTSFGANSRVSGGTLPVTGAQATALSPWACRVLSLQRDVGVVL